MDPLYLMIVLLVEQAAALKCSSAGPECTGTNKCEYTKKTFGKVKVICKDVPAGYTAKRPKLSGDDYVCYADGTSETDVLTLTDDWPTGLGWICDTSLDPCAAATPFCSYSTDGSTTTPTCVGGSHTPADIGKPETSGSDTVCILNPSVRTTGFTAASANGDLPPGCSGTKKTKLCATGSTACENDEFCLFKKSGAEIKQRCSLKPTDKGLGTQIIVDEIIYCFLEPNDDTNAYDLSAASGTFVKGCKKKLEHKCDTLTEPCEEPELCVYTKTSTKIKVGCGTLPVNQVEGSHITNADGSISCYLSPNTKTEGYQANTEWVAGCKDKQSLLCSVKGKQCEVGEMCKYTMNKTGQILATCETIAAGFQEGTQKTEGDATICFLTANNKTNQYNLTSGWVAGCREKQENPCSAFGSICEVGEVCKYEKNGPKFSESCVELPSGESEGKIKDDGKKMYCYLKANSETGKHLLNSGWVKGCDTQSNLTSPICSKSSAPCKTGEICKYSKTGSQDIQVACAALADGFLEGQQKVVGAATICYLSPNSFTTNYTEGSVWVKGCRSKQSLRCSSAGKFCEEGELCEYKKNGSDPIVEGCNSLPEGFTEGYKKTTGGITFCYLTPSPTTNSYVKTSGWLDDCKPEGSDPNLACSTTGPVCTSPLICKYLKPPSGNIIATCDTLASGFAEGKPKKQGINEICYLTANSETNAYTLKPEWVNDCKPGYACSAGGIKCDGEKICKYSKPASGNITVTCDALGAGFQEGKPKKEGSVLICYLKGNNDTESYPISEKWVKGCGNGSNDDNGDNDGTCKIGDTAVFLNLFVSTMILVSIW